MHRNRVILLLSLLLFSLLGQSLYAQWGFTVSIHYSGKCFEAGSFPSMSVPVAGIPTKEQCEALRRSFQSMSFNIDGCKISVVCSSSVGSDMVGVQQGGSNVMINDVSFGNPVLSRNPGQSIQDWINDVQKKAEILNVDYTQINNKLPTTGSKGFDDIYKELYIKNKNRSFAYEGKAKLLEVDDLSTLKVRSQSAPELGVVHEMDNTKSNLIRQMQNALEELNKIERLCSSPAIDCAYYSNRKEQADSLFHGAKQKLYELERTESDSRITKYRQELEEYEKEIKLCQNDFCEYPLRKAIEGINEKISAEVLEASKIRLNIDERIKVINENESQITRADKLEESANERLRRIEEERSTLLVDLNNGKITAMQFAAMNKNLSAQEKAALNDILVAKADRTATNSLEWVKKNKDVIVNGAIDVAEIGAHAAVNVTAKAAAAETLGTSIAVEPAAHIGISMTADIIREIYNGDGKKSAGTLLMDAGRTTLIGTGIGFGIDKGADKLAGKIAKRTIKNLNHKDVSPSEAIDTWDAGWSIATGLNFTNEAE